MRQKIVYIVIGALLMLVALSIGNCIPTSNVPPPPTPPPITPTSPAPPVNSPVPASRPEITNLQAVFTGNRYYDNPDYRGPYSRNQNSTGTWYFNGTSYVYRYRSNPLEEKDFRMGDNFKIEFDVGLIGSVPIENLVMELMVPGQFNVESKHGSAYSLGDYTVIQLDPIKVLKPGQTVHYSVCVQLCNANEQYECKGNLLESRVIAKANGVYEEVPLFITVWRWCEEDRGSCEYSSCCSTCTSCTDCPDCPGCNPVGPPGPPAPQPEQPCPGCNPVGPPASPAPQPEQPCPGPGCNPVGPPAPLAPGQQPYVPPQSGGPPAGPAVGPGGPLPNSAIP